MAKPVIIGPSYSTYVRTVRISLIEKGVDYDIQEVDLFGGGAKQPDYLALHPFGVVPAFRHDDFVVYETIAICSYVDAAFPGGSLFPADARGKARAVQFASILGNYAYKPIIGIVRERVVKPLFKQETDEAAIRDMLPDAQKALRAMEAIAGDGDWLVGSAISLADAFLVV